jgi:ribosome-associated protein
MPRPVHPPDPQSEVEEGPSKTRRKQAMHALQDLGERLGELKPEQLRQFDLPEALVIAINDYRRFTKWEAKRRQMQYIGRLMRDIDPAPITALLDQSSQTSREAVAGFHAAEAWRDKLLAGDAALDALVAQHPEADRQRIAQLT